MDEDEGDEEEDMGDLDVEDGLDDGNVEEMVAGVESMSFGDGVGGVESDEENGYDADFSNDEGTGCIFSSDEEMGYVFCSEENGESGL
jgi:hypothetical protein